MKKMPSADCLKATLVSDDTAGANSRPLQPERRSRGKPRAVPQDMTIGAC
jgi:hypothetical protein